MNGPRHMPTPARIEMMPPPALPAAHFALAFGCLLLGAAGLVAAAPDLAAGAYLAFPVVGTTHLFTLGWITSSIMGVLYQFVPVGLGVPIASVRAARATFTAFLPGVLLFVLGAGLGRPALSHAGAALLAAAILLFAGNLGVTLARAPARGITWWGLAIGGANLVGVLALGLALAMNLETGFMAASRLGAVAAHAHLALLGWVMPIVVGVGYRLLPMFLLSPGTDRRPAAVALALLGAGAPVLAVGLGFEQRGLAWAGAALAYGGLLAWLLQARLYFRQRRLARLDASMRLAAAGALSLAGAATLAPVLLVVGRSHVGLVTAYGLLALLGVSLFVVGHYYRIVPHFVWRLRYMPLAGSRPLPRPSDMVAPRPAATAGALLTAGGVLLVAGVLVGGAVATRAGALVFAAGAAVAAAQMASIARCGRATGGRVSTSEKGSGLELFLDPGRRKE